MHLSNDVNNSTVHQGKVGENRFSNFLTQLLILLLCCPGQQVPYFAGSLTDARSEWSNLVNDNIDSSDQRVDGVHVQEWPLSGDPAEPKGRLPSVRDAKQ